MKFILMRTSSVFRSLPSSAILIALSIFLCVTAGVAQSDEQTDPVKIFNQGQDAHEKGDLQTALKFYDHAIKLAPEFPEAEYQRGVVLISLGKINEAEKSFRRAIELREDWALPRADLGSILISKNLFAEAERVLNKAIELDAQNFPAYSALTQMHLRAQSSPEVLKELLKRIQLLNSKHKDQASLWAAQGALERTLGDQSAARKSLDNALAIEPNNSFALSERAEIFLSQKNFSSAIEDSKRLVRVSPNSTSAKIRLAQVYATSGNADEASKILDGLDASNPEVLSLKNSIAVFGTEDISALEKQLEKDIKNAAILSRLCNLTRTSAPQKSLDYCRRASEADPSNLNHVIGYGAALVQARQFENAIALFRKILQIEPDNFTARANLATALFESKRFAEAKSEYKWLVEKKPELAISYYFLAITHDQMSEYAEAITNYQQFLQIAVPRQNQLEIDKVNLRLPAVQKLLKQKRKK